VLPRISSGLLTLTGAGGSGKTRLAFAVNAEFVHAFPDGIWLTELAGVNNPELLPGLVAEYLAVAEQPGRPNLGTLLGELGSRSLLLLIDNCEHLIATFFADPR
jgi:predicted ATPase